MSRPLALASVLFGLLLVVVRCSNEPSLPDGDPREVAVLLHGLGRTASSMVKLGERLEAGGYRVELIDYPSTTATMQELLAQLDDAVVRCCAAAPELHFVTYSLGGILVRAYLAEHPPPNLGRVVMLAPPNRGSEWVDQLGEYRAFERVLGPVARELGTDEDSLPNRLGPAEFEFGVIAGTASINPLGWLLIPGEDDGTVSVESTKLPGMADFLALPASHTFIMNSPEAAAATMRFLATGRFREDESGRGAGDGD